jgi:cytidylate kinase
MKKIQIAIDGPSGAGKSTMAKIVSKELGILYLDTGAMYRAVALKAIKSGIGTKDSAALAKMVEDIDIRIDYKDGQQKVYLDGEAVRALLIHPLANDYNQIERALDELLKAHRDYLPQFSSNGANLYRRLISIS